MTLRHPDPFIDPTNDLDPEINPYVTAMIDGAKSGALQISYGPGLRDLAGNWKIKFADYMDAAPSQIICELGCHKGGTLCEMAAANPDIAFVGVDITFKRVVTTARRAKNQGLKNVHVLLANGRGLDHFFSAGELDGYVMFFPDPWSKKKRQMKNRLFNDAFAKTLIPLINEGGFVWFKSDQENYVKEACAILDQQGFTPIGTSQGFLSQTYETTFEGHFRKQDLPTYSFQRAKLSGLNEAAVGNCAPLGNRLAML